MWRDGRESHYLPGHNTAYKREHLPASTLGLIYGTLLGDTSIAKKGRNSTPTIYFTHGACQRSYAEYKAKRLTGLRVTTEIVVNKGFGDKSCRGRSNAHPELRPVLDIVGHPKRVTARWLARISEEGWAWYYMDDGSITRGGIQFHTEGYTAKECRLLAKFLSKRFSIIATVKPTKKYHIIVLRVASAIHWLRRLRHFAAPGMEYKFPDDYERHRRPSSWKEGTRFRLRN